MKGKTKIPKTSGSGCTVSRYEVIRSTGLIALCLLFFAAMMQIVSPAAASAEVFSCMECHKDNPIDPVRFEKSVHRDMSCTECHQSGFDKGPHAGKAAHAPSCIECHEGAPAWDEAVQEVRASVHARMIDANFSCTNCHDPHYILPIKAILGSPEGMAAMNRSCLQCHAEGKTPADVKAAKDKLVAKHKRISFADTHLRRTPCVACHTPAEAGRIHLILPASKAIDDCAMCHSKKSLLTEKFSLFLSGNETPERGWSNAALYNSNVYLTGATRNLWIDRVALLALVLALAGIGAHALLRLFFGCFRRKS